MSDIDKILREDAHTPIADDGFTARVMGALPARAARERAWLRPALVFGSAALGSLLAALFAPGGYALLEGFAELTELRAVTPAAIAAIGISGTLLVSALVFAAGTD
jgi:hypothetical protein